MDDLCFVTLRCKDCENDKCTLCPQGTWISEDSLQGCTRKVTEEEKVKFIHYQEEVVPFLHLSKNKNSERSIYKEVISFLQEIYSKPIGTKIGKRGKAIK